MSISDLLADIEQKGFPHAVVLDPVVERIRLELLAELLRKGNVTSIIESSLTKDQDSILVLQRNELAVIVSIAVTCVNVSRIPTCWTIVSGIG